MGLARFSVCLWPLLSIVISVILTTTTTMTATVCSFRCVFGFESISRCWIYSLLFFSGKCVSSAALLLLACPATQTILYIQYSVNVSRSQPKFVWFKHTNTHTHTRVLFGFLFALYFSCRLRLWVWCMFCFVVCMHSGPFCRMLYAVVIFCSIAHSAPLPHSNSSLSLSLPFYHSLTLAAWLLSLAHSSSARCVVSSSSSSSFFYSFHLCSVDFVVSCLFFIFGNANKR